MKKTASILLFLLAFNGFSQSLEKLKTASKKLYDANYLMDFEAIVEFTYPKITTSQADKQAALEDVERHYENAEYRLRLQLEKVPFQFGNIIESDGKKFCIITFRNPIRYTFEAKLTDAMVAEQKTRLEETNQTKEVTFEPKRNSFNVRKTTTYLAVFDENTNNDWKFLNFDIATQRAFFEDHFKDAKKELGL